MTEAVRARYVDAATIAACLSPEAAVEAVLAGLRGDIDPAADVPRSLVPLRQGDLLLMPAQSTSSVGVKLATVARTIPRADCPDQCDVRVVRRRDTAADSPAGWSGAHQPSDPGGRRGRSSPWLDRLDEPLRVVAFGGGPQGLGHLRTVAAVHSVATSAVVVRQPDRVELPKSLSSTRVLAADDADVPGVLGEAHLVVCATTARAPLFDSRLLGNRAIVVAVGSHEAEAREVDAAFCAALM